MELPLREQGTIITGIRGCDDAPKTPGRYDTPERQLTAYLRFCVMNPADLREVGIAGAFFQDTAPEFKQSELGHFPTHWYSHLMHAYEVVAYRCPDEERRNTADSIYGRLVSGLHLYPESKDQMVKRLSEDRIANNTVVS